MVNKKDKTLKDPALAGLGPYIKVNNDAWQKINLMYQYKEIFSKFPRDVLSNMISSVIENNYSLFFKALEEGINYLEKIHAAEIQELQDQINDLEIKVEGYRKQNNNLESKLKDLEKEKTEVDMLTKNIKGDYEKWKALYNQLKNEVNNYKNYKFEKVSIENVKDTINLLMAENYDENNHKLSMERTFLIFFEWVKYLVNVGNYILLGHVAPYIDAYWAEIVMNDPTYLSKLILE